MILFSLNILVYVKHFVTATKERLFAQKHYLNFFFAECIYKTPKKAYLCTLKIVFNHQQITYMLIIDTRESDSIDKALKKYKKKYEKAGILRQLRRRKAFTKPSVNRRTEILKAVYRNQMQLENA